MESTYLNNQLLIAMPSLQDPNFQRSVVYICEHNEEGAVGIVINRPTNMRMVEIFDQMGIPCHDDTMGTQPVYYGGPVQQDRGFVLHLPFGGWRSTLESSSEISVTSSRDILEAIAKNEGPEKFIFAVGYAGWGPQQLEQEVLENAWLSCTASPAILFEVPHPDRWKRAAGLLGVDIDNISRSSGHA